MTPVTTFTPTAHLSVLALALLACTGALAQDARWYFGANAGQSQATVDEGRIIGGLQANGLATTAINPIHRDLGYKVYGGYQFNPRFALEGGYYNLGQFGFTANTSPLGSLTGQTKLQGVNLDAVGTWPLSDTWSVFGRVGLAYTHADDAFSGTGAVSVLDPNPSTRQTNLKVGVGVQVALTDAWLLRAEVERYRIDDAVGNQGDIDLVSLGLVYRFGGKTPTPAPTPMVAQVVTPTVVVAVAVPAEVAPPPVPVVVVPAKTKVTFAADALFDFDNASVKPSGRQHLDQFVAELQGVSFETIVVTGHTDRIGKQAYNQKLSERRAAAVSTYLVTNAGISPDKITALGVNGSDPTTRPGDCVGTKATPALIACLQPDRRVDLEVTGKR